MDSFLFTWALCNCDLLILCSSNYFNSFPHPSYGVKVATKLFLACTTLFWGMVRNTLSHPVAAAGTATASARPSGAAALFRVIDCSQSHMNDSG